MKRMVRVFIADPNENVPLESSLLYEEKEHLTDLSDEELFYCLNIKELLDKHNEKRVAFVDKEATKRAGKDIFLEPIKIRELKMTVEEIATF